MKTLYSSLNPILGIGMIILITGCSAAGGGSSNASASPGTPGITNPIAEVAPGPVTIVIKNALVGQIRQIATGDNGWTAIGGSDLVLDLDCTLDAGGRVLCNAYPIEPYAYTVE